MLTKNKFSLTENEIYEKTRFLFVFRNHTLFVRFCKDLLSLY